MYYIKTLTTPPLYLKEIRGVLYLTWVFNKENAMQFPNALIGDGIAQTLQMLEPTIPFELEAHPNH